jgi:hypothetical protein
MRRAKTSMTKHVDEALAFSCYVEKYVKSLTPN